MLGAALDEVFGDFAEARGSVAVGREFGDGFCCHLVCDLMRTLKAVDRRISCLLLGSVFSGGFSQGGGSFLDVENIVGDLEEQAERFAETAEARNIFRR